MGHGSQDKKNEGCGCGPGSTGTVHAAAVPGRGRQTTGPGACGGDPPRGRRAMTVSRIVRFVTMDVWRIRDGDLPRGTYVLLRPFRIIILAFRGLGENKCRLRASAMTFYSLLSIGPVVAMVFGIAKGFGFERVFENHLLRNMRGHEEEVMLVIDFARALLENAKGGVIAGIGIVMLLWTVVKLLSHIEDSFNDIWGVKRHRSLGRRISDFLSLFIICPILFVTSSATTVLIASHVQIAAEKIAILESFDPAIVTALKLLPFCVIWSLLTFIYLFMPNTKVRFLSGLLGGVVAGTMYQLFQWGYINFQIGVSRMNAVYGSFAALPLFLIWLQMSWLIVLFGAEICFAHQNVDTFEYGPDCSRLSPFFKKILALRIVHLLVKEFETGGVHRDEQEISCALEAPMRCVRDILNDLVASGLVSEISAGKDQRVAYQPGLDPSLITVHYVLDRLDRNGVSAVPLLKSRELDTLTACLAYFNGLVAESPANVRLKDI